MDPVLALALVSSLEVAAPLSTPADSAVAADTLASAESGPDTTRAAIGADTAATRPRLSLVARARRTAGAFASDVWVVASSPARLNRHGAVRLGIALGITGVLYAYDQELLDASLRNRDEPFWHGVQEVGSFVEPVGFMGRTNPYYAGAMVLGYVFNVRPLREIPAQILESHMISGGVRNAFKVVLGRRRPFEDKGPRFFEFNGGTSFPSGHTSVVFELATILSHHAHFMPVTIAAYGLATTAALERVHSRAHWPSDLFLSAVSGTMIARAVIRRHEERAARWSPKVGWNDGALRIEMARSF